MANNKKSDNNLIARASHLLYEFPNDLLVGWEAQSLGDDKYLIKRPATKDGESTYRTIDLHMPMLTIDGTVMPSKDDSGVLLVGSRSVIIGENIEHGWHARKQAKSAGEQPYLIFNEKMNQMGKVFLGQKHGDEDVTLIKPHLLKVGDKIIPVAPKKLEITILIQSEDVGSGKLAYINVIEPGNPNNRKDARPVGGRPYYLRPIHKSEPGRFFENFGGNDVCTAQFWMRNGSNRIKALVRTPQDALLEISLKRKLEFLSHEALDCGIDPEEYAEYIDAKKLINEVNMRWKEIGMACMSQGKEWFIPLDELDEKYRHSQSSPSPSR